MPVSKNMNYYFNKQYFDDLKVDIAEERRASEEKTAHNNFTYRNEDITKFQFELSDGSMRPWKIDGVDKFDLTTLYPGLLMGTGNVHDLKNDDAIKCGFSFDYVSGLPYLPGSSLKGLLRSYFPDNQGKEKEREQNKESYIKFLLGKENINIEELKSNIFDNGDIFLDVFPSEKNDKKLLDLEYITPHKKGPFSSPVPIRLVKVVPNVTFVFCFLLLDYKKNGEVVVSKKEKLDLFKAIILDMGMGAKTNVGFGKLQEGKVPYKKPENDMNGNSKNRNNNQDNRTRNNVQNMKSNGKCAKCGKPTKISKKTNTYYKCCFECFITNNR